jgi:hypothetical protein
VKVKTKILKKWFRAFTAPKTHLTLLWILLSNTVFSADTTKIDSLKNLILVTKDDSIKASCLNKLGEIFYSEGKFEKAKEMLYNGLSIAKSTGLTTLENAFYLDIFKNV